MEQRTRRGICFAPVADTGLTLTRRDEPCQWRLHECCKTSPPSGSPRQLLIAQRQRVVVGHFRRRWKLTDLSKLCLVKVPTSFEVTWPILTCRCQAYLPPTEQTNLPHTNVDIADDPISTCWFLPQRRQPGCGERSTQENTATEHILQSISLNSSGALTPQ
jgi:hypothetical protein